MGLEKLKFLLVALGFILFLWWLGPDSPDEGEVGASIGNVIIREESGQEEVVVGRNPDGSAITALAKPMNFRTQKVLLKTQRGRLPLILGLAYTPEQQQAGMMHYKEWPKTMHGLLFLFRKEERYSMWMRNTHIPLDMLFIDRTGTIVSIRENTLPLSEIAITAPVPIVAILEVEAGSTRKWNINIGDQFLMKYFNSLPEEKAPAS